MFQNCFSYFSSKNFNGKEDVSGWAINTNQIKNPPDAKTQPKINEIQCVL